MNMIFLYNLVGNFTVFIFIHDGIIDSIVCGSILVWRWTDSCGMSRGQKGTVVASSVLQ